RSDSIAPLPCGHTYRRRDRDSAASGRSRRGAQERGRPRTAVVAAHLPGRRAGSAATGPERRLGTLPVAGDTCLRATLRSSWALFALILNASFTKDQVPDHAKRNNEQNARSVS